MFKVFRCCAKHIWIIYFFLKVIQKAVNSGIEKELILTAGKNNCNLKVYKTEESNQQKPSTSTNSLFLLLSFI